MRAKFTLSPNQIKNLENHGIYPEVKTITRAEKIGHIIANGITYLMSGIFLYAITIIIIQLITKF